MMDGSVYMVDALLTGTEGTSEEDHGGDGQDSSEGVHGYGHLIRRGRGYGGP